VHEVALTAPQADMFELEAKFPLFVVGFGAGKTETLITCVFRDLFNHPGADIGTYAPTFDTLKLNLVPRIEEILTLAHIPYQLNKSEYICRVEGHGKIIMRSMDNPARIIAYEVFRSHVDEIDTMAKDKAAEAWNKIVGRNRQKIKGALNTVSAYTTPEGFNFVYDKWAKDPVAAKALGYEYVTAPTYSNPHLPEDYIEGLKATYPAALVQAYIEGKFVNLTSGAVYVEFDRETCHTDIVHNKKDCEPIHIGMDFNVNNMSAVIHVIRGGQAYAVDEITRGRDTPSIIQTIKNHFDGCSVIIYPDASGGSTSTMGASLSDISLLKSAGFKVDAPKKNPFVRDRVLSMNSAFKSDTLWVNVEKCPEYTLCLEQQAYNDKGEPDKSSNNDHLPDAGGYFIHRKYPIIKSKPKLARVVGY